MHDQPPLSVEEQPEKDEISQQIDANGDSSNAKLTSYKESNIMRES